MESCLQHTSRDGGTNSLLNLHRKNALALFTPICVRFSALALGKCVEPARPSCVRARAAAGLASPGTQVLRRKRLDLSDAYPRSTHSARAKRLGPEGMACPRARLVGKSRRRAAGVSRNFDPVAERSRRLGGLGECVYPRGQKERRAACPRPRRTTRSQTRRPPRCTRASHARSGEAK